MSDRARAALTGILTDYARLGTVRPEVLRRAEVALESVPAAAVPLAPREPSPAAIEAASKAHDELVVKFLDGASDLHVGDAMRAALRAAYAVDGLGAAPQEEP